MLLADVRAKPRGATDHLVVEDAALDPADEDEIANGRHVDACGEQIDRDDIFRIGIVLELQDQVVGLVDRAGDLRHHAMRHAFCAIFLLQFLDQQTHDVIGMGIAGGENQRLSGFGWRNFSGDRAADNAVKGFRVDASVEVGEVVIERDFVRQLEEIDLARLAVDDLDLLATLEMNASL